MDNKKKSFCYKDNCKAIITGFRWNDWYVCKVCKLELTEQLYNKIKEKDKSLEDVQKEIERMLDEQL